MRAYFIRRLLLVPVTMFGVTLIVFTVTRFVPGGPMERMLHEQAEAAVEGAAATRDAAGLAGLSEADLEELEEEYNLDKSIPVAYMMWLGVMPREVRLTKAEFGGRADELIGFVDDEREFDPERMVRMVPRGSGRTVLIEQEGGEVVSAKWEDDGSPIEEEGWQIRVESEQDRKERFANRMGMEADDENVPGYPPRAVVYRNQYSGLFQGDLGRSLSFGDPVTTLIWQRIPIALYFGILTYIITFAVCIPLGIVKAIKHRTWVDNTSSVLIFIGYSVPNFALGAIMLVYLGARLGWFPMFGLVSEGWAEMGMFEKVTDLAHHTVLPLTCYVIGSFAFMTMMLKNNLMDNLAADYVRTAMAKGVSFRRAVLRHAFRNSIIPIIAGIGNFIVILVSGSILIEQVFDIQGFGLLGFQAIISRDFPVFLGVLTIAAFLSLLGNVLSDMILALVDPRIRFD